MKTVVETKNKPVSHLRKNDVLVLTNEISGKQYEYKVQGAEFDDQNYPNLPWRVHLAVQDGDTETVATVGFDNDENVDVKA